MKNWLQQRYDEKFISVHSVVNNKVYDITHSVQDNFIKKIKHAFSTSHLPKAYFLFQSSWITQFSLFMY
jgi:hypothetical protein